MEALFVNRTNSKFTYPERTGAHETPYIFKIVAELLPYLPTYQDNLSIFVGELRDQIFTSQQDAADHFHLDRTRISRYENFKAPDKPKIGYLACLAKLIAEKTGDISEVQETLLKEINKVVVSRHYRKSRFRDWTALCNVADTYLDKQRAKSTPNSSLAPTSKAQTSVEWQTRLETRLDLPPTVHLIGVRHHLNELLDNLISDEAPWILAIDGLGGIGKTSLANALIRRPELPGRFHNIAWVSAKQHNFRPGVGLEEVSSPALHADTLIDSLLEQLDSDVPLSLPSQQKLIALAELLKEAPYLVVLDNLETLSDYEALLPTLAKLANPSKFLLTIRYSLQGHSDIFCLSLKELNKPDTIDFIRKEAKTRGLSDLVDASENQLEKIHAVVGGNPLALKLVVGQTSALSLSQVLEHLKQAKGKKTEDLYTYIYWQAWELLDQNCKKTLIMMPLAKEGTQDQLLALTKFDTDVLEQALQRLVELSLVQPGGDLEVRRYTIHRLTETFLLQEALKWQTSA